VVHILYDGVIYIFDLRKLMLFFIVDLKITIKNIKHGEVSHLCIINLYSLELNYNK
jgi:hypothetical protein